MRRTRAEWAELAQSVVIGVAKEQGAFSARELEARAADVAWGGYPTINPHYLGPALTRLVGAGEIQRHTQETRGSSLQTAFTLADPTKEALRSAGRKRLLQARYLSWTNTTRDWSPSPVGAALERVLHSSLVAAAPHGYTLLNPQGGGEVKELLGARVPGGPLDNAAWLHRFDSQGVPLKPILVVAEAKNLREWIYPRTQELYQLLDKAVSVQVAHPNISIVPLLICRRAHYTTGAMAKQMGFHVTDTKVQYVRPVILNIEDGQRKVDEVVSGLGFDIALHETQTDALVRQFTEYLPGRIEEAADRWRQVALHPDVPDLVAQLRDEDLRPDQRTPVRDDLARCATEVTGEPALWASNDLD